MENKNKWAEVQLTREQAIAFHDSGEWKNWTYEQKVRFQLFQKKLCIPFDVFHEAVEKVLDRPVYTHEFANYEAIVMEYLGEKQAPTMDEIINMIPAEKRIVLNL